MTVSNRQLSIAIIVAFFAGVLVYFFLWFGYIEIFVNHAEVENFIVKSREKIYQCSKNPCRIKVRAGSKFIAEVQHKLVNENSKIFIKKVPLWKTKKIVIRVQPDLPEIKAEKIPRNFGKKIDGKTGFPILIAPDGKFQIFAKNFAGFLNIFIQTTGKPQLLTRIKDDFQVVFLNKNFSLTSNGIIIPAKNRVYYYDFATQRKFKILEINSLRLQNISVSADAQKVIFYNLKTKNWQEVFLNSDQKPLILKDNENFAGFFDKNLIEIHDNKIFINNVPRWKTPFPISADISFRIHENNLILEKDFTTWNIKIPRN